MKLADNVWKTRPLYHEDFVGTWVAELAYDIAAVNAFERVYGGVSIAYSDQREHADCPGQHGSQCCGHYELCRQALKR